jgi:hypothetical protein
MSNLKVNSINDANGGNTAKLYGVSMRDGGTGWVNRIINGDMQVAQRGNLILSANGTTFGGPDRFFLTVGGFSTVSVIALQAGAVFPGSAYCYQIGNLLTTGGPGTVTVTQRIESANSYDLNSQPVTITLKVLQQTGASVNAQIVLRKPSTKDNFASVSLVANSSLIPVPDSTITTLTFTTTLGASDASNGLQVELYFPTMPATASKQIYIGQWQLEAGSVATPFERRDYGRELMMCQRYLPAWSGSGPISSGWCAGSTSAFAEIALPVAPRVAPTGITVSSASHFAVYNSGAGSVTCTSVIFNQGSLSSLRLNVGVASGLVAGNGTGFVGAGAAQLLATGCEL